MLRQKNYLAEKGQEVDLPNSVDKVFAESAPLAAAIAASGTMHIAFGERAGERVRGNQDRYALDAV